MSNIEDRVKKIVAEQLGVKEEVLKGRSNPLSDLEVTHDIAAWTWMVSSNVNLGIGAEAAPISKANFGVDVREIGRAHV